MNEQNEQKELIETNLENLLDENNQFLSYGNTNPIPIAMYGFEKEDLVNYPYHIEKIVDYEKEKAYVIVAKVIDMESYQKLSGLTLAMEAQMKISLYEISKLRSEKPLLREIGSVTTDTNDRKEYALNVRYDKNTGVMNMLEPDVTYKDNEIEVRMSVYGNHIKEKIFKFEIEGDKNGWKKKNISR